MRIIWVCILSVASSGICAGPGGWIHGITSGDGDLGGRLNLGRSYRDGLFSHSSSRSRGYSRSSTYDSSYRSYSNPRSCCSMATSSRPPRQPCCGPGSASYSYYPIYDESCEPRKLGAAGQKPTSDPKPLSKPHPAPKPLAKSTPTPAPTPAPAPSMVVPKEDQIAYMRVRLPSNAKVYLDDRLTSSTGTNRSFITTPLEADKWYEFKFTVVWETEYGPLSKTEKISVKQGHTTEVGVVLNSTRDALMIESLVRQGKSF